MRRQVCSGKRSPIESAQTRRPSDLVSRHGDRSLPPTGPGRSPRWHPVPLVEHALKQSETGTPEYTSKATARADDRPSNPRGSPPRSPGHRQRVLSTLTVGASRAANIRVKLIGHCETGSLVEVDGRLVVRLVKIGSVQTRGDMANATVGEVCQALLEQDVAQAPAVQEPE